MAIFQFEQTNVNIEVCQGHNPCPCLWLFQLPRTMTMVLSIAMNHGHGSFHEHEPMVMVPGDKLIMPSESLAQSFILLSSHHRDCLIKSLHFEENLAQRTTYDDQMTYTQMTSMFMVSLIQTHRDQLAPNLPRAKNSKSDWKH